MSPTIISVAGHTPDISRAAFVAPTATIVGDVTLQEGASIWYGTVLRAEHAPIVIGPHTNVQDLCVVHTDPGHPTTIGASVTIGHRVIVHGATIDDDALIGMGAVVLNGAHVGQGALVAASALVRENQRVPSRALAVGVPASIREDHITDDALPFPNAESYHHLAAMHATATTSEDTL